MSEVNPVTDVTEVTLPLDDVVPGSANRIEVGGMGVCLVRIDDDVYAIGDVCTHAEVSLSDGDVDCEAREIECPAHGSVFSLVDGVPGTLPATHPVPVFDVTVVDGMVTVRVTTGGAP